MAPWRRLSVFQHHELQYDAKYKILEKGRRCCNLYKKRHYIYNNLQYTLDNFSIIIIEINIQGGREIKTLFLYKPPDKNPENFLDYLETHFMHDRKLFIIGYMNITYFNQILSLKIYKSTGYIWIHNLQHRISHSCQWTNDHVDQSHNNEVQR